MCSFLIRLLPQPNLVVVIDDLFAFINEVICAELRDVGMLSTRNAQKRGNLLHLHAAFDDVSLLCLADLSQHFDLCREDHLAELKLVLVSGLDRIDVHLVLLLPVGYLFQPLLLLFLELLPELDDLDLPSV